MKNTQLEYYSSDNSSSAERSSLVNEKKKATMDWKTNSTTHPKMIALHDGFGSKDFDRFYKNIKVVIEDH